MKFCYKYTIIALFSIFIIANSQESDIKSIFKNLINVVNISEKINQKCENQNYCFKELNSNKEKSISIEIEKETTSNIVGHVIVPLTLNYHLKSPQIEYFSDFYFDAKVKYFTVTRKDGKYTVGLDNVTLVFSFRTVPLYNYFSLAKSLGGFGVSITTFFDDIVNSLKDVIIKQVTTQVKNTFESFGETNVIFICFYLFFTYEKF
jgi:hypothetical protein